MAHVSSHKSIKRPDNHIKYHNYRTNFNYSHDVTRIRQISNYQY